MRNFPTFQSLNNWETLVHLHPSLRQARAPSVNSGSIAFLTKVIPMSVSVVVNQCFCRAGKLWKDLESESPRNSDIVGVTDPDTFHWRQHVASCPALYKCLRPLQMSVKVQCKSLMYPSTSTQLVLSETQPKVILRWSEWVSRVAEQNRGVSNQGGSKLSLNVRYLTAITGRQYSGKSEVVTYTSFCQILLK